MPGSIYDWAVTPADNATADADINWSENQDPDTVNNSARQEMARVAEWLTDTRVSRASTGAANVYNTTGSSDPGSWRDGLRGAFRAHQTNTSAATLQYRSYGGKPLRRKSGVALLPGEIEQGAYISWSYAADTDEVIVTSGTSHFGGASGDVLARIIPVGTPILSWDSRGPAPGYIRLTEVWSNWSQTTYPELYLWRLAQTWAHAPAAPVGQFNMPPAAGYFMRAIATSTTVDPDGARLPGVVQNDELKGHGHTASGATSVTINNGNNVTLSTANTTALAGGGIATVDANTVSRVTVTASASTTVTVTPTSGSETRGKNVGYYVDVLAVPAQASAATLGVGGLAYRFDTATANANPGSGRLRFNNATPSAVTELYISDVDGYGANIGSVLQSIPANSQIYLFRVGSPAIFAAFTINAPLSNSGSYDVASVTFVGASVAPFDLDGALSVLVMRAGIQGVASTTPGPPGPNIGLDYLWKTATSGDPGAGGILVNNALVSAATALHIRKTNRVGSNQDTYILSWDDSTTLTDRGTLRIVDIAAPGTNFVEYSVSGSLTDLGTYVTFPVQYRGGPGGLTNDMQVAAAFFRSGDKGVDGVGAGDVTGPASAVDGEVVLFNGSTGKAVRRASTTGLLKASSGVLQQAIAGTDYAPATSGTAVLKGSGSGGFAAAVAGTDYAPATSGTAVLKGNGAGGFSAAVTTDLGAGKKAVPIRSVAMTPRITNGPSRGVIETTTNRIMLSTLDFDTTTQEFAQFEFPMPKSWNEGTVTALFWWSHAATGTNFGVTWAIEAVALSNDDASDAAFGTAVQINDVGGTTNDLYFTAETPALTIGGSPQPEDLVVFQVKRVPADAGDTMAIDARLHGVTLYFTTDAITDA